MGVRESYFANGWCRFPADPALTAWVEHALPAARAAVADRENAEWLRCGGTWFVGVHALPNDRSGIVDGGPVLAGEAVTFLREVLELGLFEWDRAQVSSCYPGYPQPSASEPEPAYRYHIKRAAAHIDGLRAEGPERRRHLREHHGFLLGVPMVEAGAGASPLVVWEGSHEIARDAFHEIYDGMAPQDWGEVDVTQAYHALRRRIFGACERIEIPARPGEAYLVHRLALHGITPWDPSAEAGPDGRMIAYFRPEIGGPENWLEAP